MPYCRRCGTQLEDTARFCHRCGTPVDPNMVPIPPPYQPYPSYQQSPAPEQASPPKPIRKDPLVIATVALVTILLIAVVIAAFMVVPANPWGISRSLSDENPAAETLNLNFHTNIGDVNIMTLKVGDDRNVLITAQANGTHGVLGGSDIPVTFQFDNQTVGDTLTVNSAVSIKEAYTARSNLDIQIFLDPALKLNLNVSSSTGKVSFVADKATTLEALNLESSTGEVEASLAGNMTLAGDVSLSSSTSEVNFRLSENAIVGNHTVNLQSSTGYVIADLVQTRAFNGNLQVNAASSTGSVSVGLTIDGAVAGNVESQTGAFGDVHTNLNNFYGNDTSVQSPNYPSACNIEVNATVDTGDIYIDADYRTQLVAN